MYRSRSVVALTAIIAFGVLGTQPPALATTLPSGEVVVGKTVIEPAYDDMTGSLIYLSTPMGSAQHVNPVFARNVAPIYLPVYPAGTNVGTLNCAHLPTENCPDHGDIVAGAAMSIMPSVYERGVAGHDHLVGVAATGGDFNILWEPVLVLFTNSTAAQTHVTTLTQITSLLLHGDAIEIPIKEATFPCAVVSAHVYSMGTPYNG